MMADGAAPFRPRTRIVGLRIAGGGGARIADCGRRTQKTQLQSASPREERLASAASEENFELQSAAVQGGKWALDGDNGRSIFGDGVFASHFDWTTFTTGTTFF